MLTPGPKSLTQVPKFENEARASVMSLAPATSAKAPWAGSDPLTATSAGDSVQASAPEFPAAIAYVTPDAIEFWMAVSSGAKAPPPRLMLATAGLMAFEVTQFTPLITPESLPSP